MMDDDLIELLAAWQGDELELTRRDELLARLRGDDAFQQAFVDEICMLGMLKVVQSTEPRWLRLQDELGWGSSAKGAGADDELEEIFMRRVGAMTSQRAPAPRSRRMWVAAAVVLAAAGLTAIAWNWPTGRRGRVPIATAPAARARPVGGLALVVKLDGVQWEPESGEAAPISEGTILAPGRLRLRGGRATLTFYSGVMLTLEGPADVDLLTSDRVFCRRGKLRARVPEGAEGFVVTTADLAVIDLGTEFALNVDADGRGRVMVFEGQAEAALLGAAGTPGLTQLVEPSKAFELDPRAGRIAESAAGPEGFVPAPVLPAPPLLLDPAYPGAVLGARPRGYWRFESLTEGAVPNEVEGGVPLRLNGPVALSGPSADNDHAIFRDGAPEQFFTSSGLWEVARDPGHAVELWFLSEGISHASLVGLFMPKDHLALGKHGRHVHSFLVELTALDRRSLYKPASVRFLHRWPLDTRVGNNLFSDDVYIPRRWHHVVAQKNGDRMELFLDGVLGRSMPLDPDHPTLACRLVVGRRAPDPREQNDTRSFVGRLDEIAIYDHPLSADEVRRHFELARASARPESVWRAPVATTR